MINYEEAKWPVTTLVAFEMMCLVGVMWVDALEGVFIIGTLALIEFVSGALVLLGTHLFQPKRRLLYMPYLIVKVVYIILSLVFSLILFGILMFSSASAKLAVCAAFERINVEIFATWRTFDSVAASVTDPHSKGASEVVMPINANATLAMWLCLLWPIIASKVALLVVVWLAYKSDRTHDQSYDVEKAELDESHRSSSHNTSASSARRRGGEDGLNASYRRFADRERVNVVTRTPLKQQASSITIIHTTLKQTTEGVSFIDDAPLPAPPPSHQQQQQQSGRTSVNISEHPKSGSSSTYADALSIGNNNNNIGTSNV